MTNIDYINAENGGIKMYSGVGNVVGWGKTAKHIAYVIATHGLADAVLVEAAWTLQTKKGLTTTMVRRFFGMKKLLRWQKL